MTDFASDTLSASEQRESIAVDVAEAFEHHTGESSGDTGAAEPPREASSNPDRSEPAESDARPEPLEKPAPQRAAKAVNAEKQSEPAGSSTSWADKNPEIFSRLPIESQRYIRELESERRDTAALKAEYAPVAKIFEPHKDKIKAAGTTPAKLIEGWSKAETRLLDRNDRANMVAEIMHAYGIDPRELVQSLQQLPGRVPAAQERQRAVATKDVANALDTFAAAKGRDGRPLYPHFKELEASMTTLAQSRVGQGKPHAQRLHELYEAALWASPKHRQAMLKQQQQAPRPNGRRELSLRESIEMAAGMR